MTHIIHGKDIGNRFLLSFYIQSTRILVFAVKEIRIIDAVPYFLNSAGAMILNSFSAAVN